MGTHSDQPSPIALTMGDPAGVGGEISIKSWHEKRRGEAPFVLLCDPEWIADVAAMIGIATPIQVIAEPAAASAVFANALPVLPIEKRVEGRPGQPAGQDAGAIIDSIERATALSRNGTTSAVVTNPINKKALYDTGFSFPGHTEFIASLCGTAEPVMMLASPTLRVVPVTIHVPLRKAIDNLRTEEIVRVGRVVADALRSDFGIANPTLAVSGLNPHAGEDGTLGTEDDEIIAPAVRLLRDQGLRVEGPIPGDALFTPDSRMTFDTAICMYHDQALIPIKALDFDNAVNVTLGLPIVRTSPDHGTAYGIAGKGTARHASLMAALDLAGMIATVRQANDD